MNLVLLRIAYPEFWFSQCLRRSRLCWVAVRRDGAREGVHTVVTGDLDELQAALAGASAHCRYPFQLAERLTVFMKLIDPPVVPPPDPGWLALEPLAPSPGPQAGSGGQPAAHDAAAAGLEPCEASGGGPCRR